MEIGFGTGRFLKETARLLTTGCIEGIDFSHTMVVMAKKRNKRGIAKGRVRIQHGDFETEMYEDDSYDAVCSANTIYFWSHPDNAVEKIFRMLRPGGKVILAFEDIDQLEGRPLDTGVFHLYSTRDIEDLLRRNGFREEIDIITKKKGSQKFHCVVATKDA
ncbi:MAG: class I SAM-dependent methyltransferase [Deltaproteobacteria bacterium]|nr:class I SAM-dependent methyltransferase [Candidatus Zymogenaceae bacterium]